MNLKLTMRWNMTMKQITLISTLIAVMLYASAVIAEEEETVKLKLNEFASKGVVTEKVKLRTLRDTLQAPAEVTFNETRRVVITARTTGWIEKVAVFANQRVKKNQVLAEVYSPEFLSAQQEYLLINARAQRPASKDQTLLSDAEQRLRILGLTDKKIKQLAVSGKSYPFLPVHSPINGTVVSHRLNVGDTVKRGQVLYVVADLRNLWANIALTESQLAQVQRGQTVSLSVQAYPEHRFMGKILSVGAVMDEQTRTIKARALVGNPERLLKVGMFADARIEIGGGKPVLAIPAGSIVQFQGQTTVFKVEGDELQPQVIEAGTTRSGWTEIKVGLAAGDEVATQGVFLLKSMLLKSQIGDVD